MTASRLRTEREMGEVQHFADEVIASAACATGICTA
nr:Uncharacterised protein [Raoultella sp. NCTC 9187]